MQTILVPMAGEGKRFADVGYTVHKPVIPTIDYRTGELLPMVVCAVKDAQNGDSRFIFVDRNFHKEGGVEDTIKKYYPNAEFITIDKLTEGQACTCLLAKELINNDVPLLIAACDNGMIYSMEQYRQAKEEADVLVFSFRNNETVLKNPDSYGWMLTDNENNITSVSIKKHISDTPMDDMAVVGTFWFRRGSIFVEIAEEMIAANDRINNEFYVDQAIYYALKRGHKTKVFEINHYLGWGTPKDYETYQNTYKYWKSFLKSGKYLGK